jgi:hypothetical protein
MKHQNDILFYVFCDNRGPYKHGEKEKLARPKSGADTYISTKEILDNQGKVFTGLAWPVIKTI